MGKIERKASIYSVRIGIADAFALRARLAFEIRLERISNVSTSFICWRDTYTSHTGVQFNRYITVIPFGWISFSNAFE